jgi:hypothetical protein
VSFTPNIRTVKAQSYQTITINANGDITPSDAAIQRMGNTYTATADLSSSIVVLANNIIINGAYHVLQGPVTYDIGVNLTAENVTVENFHITDWEKGVLGSWNNNTITNNEFTNNYEAITIYGDDYIVRQNSESNSTIALLIAGGTSPPQGDNNLITQNQIMDNAIAFNIHDSIGTTITGNNILNNDVLLMLATDTGDSILY